MALRGKSLFLYGFTIDAANQWIDFKASAMGPELSARLNPGTYSLSTLMVEIVRALQVADSNHLYFATADRDVNGGLENRVTIATSGTFLSLLFLTGTHATSSVASLIGFDDLDYTGDDEYTGSSSAGTVLVSTLTGYNYLGPDFIRKNFGSVNISASGVKESLTYSIQRFIQVEFKYEPEAKVASSWVDFFDWATQQKPYDFTPDYQNFPTVAYSVTLDGTSADGQGLSMTWQEMLPKFPFNYTTGQLRMRLTT